MRLLICAGGTGGGVYPALAVLQTLNNAEPVLWVGNQAGMDADLVQRAGVPFKGIPSAGVHGVALKSLPGNIYQLVQGYFAARRILNDFQPNVILFTGGYVAVPVALAAGKCPTLLYVPDIEPGLALKFLSRFSACIAVTAQESLAFFKSARRTVVTGYPVRPGLSRWERASAIEKFGLSNDLPVLLVFGGSKGARTLNLAVQNNLAELLSRMQIVHIAGSANWEDARNIATKLPTDLSSRYHAFPYLHEDMGAALAAADLVISRAGASILGEFPLFGLPAVLVPYPFAWRYQKVNADHLAKHGAAVVLENADLDQKLPGTVLEIITNPEKLAGMRKSMKSLETPGAAGQIAGLLLELSAGNTPAGGVAI